MLDGIFLGKLKTELESQILNSRIDSIEGLNKYDYVFKLRCDRVTKFLFLSISSHNPTIFLTDKKFEKPPVASNFTMYLRKYFEGGIVKEVNQINNDRILEIKVSKRNDFDGDKELSIIIELIGRFSNLLIVDEDKRIKEAIKELSVLESNRGVMRGMTYNPPLNDKVSPSDIKSIGEHFKLVDSVNFKEIISYISGVSPLLSNYLESSFKTSNKSFSELFSETLSNFNPTLSNNDFYFFNIFNSGESFESLSDLLYFYYEKIAKDKTLKDNNQEVYRIIKQNKKRIEKKLIKLNDDLIKSEGADIYRLKGELLLSNSYSDYRGSIIKVLNYYDNTEIEIEIDPRKSLKDNSMDYYKKYRKSKNAKEYILREIKLSNDELEYFTELESQLNHASLKDLIEIKNELELNHYLKGNNKVNKSNKKIKPNFLVFKEFGGTIYVGKNNIQNNYLTHTLARKNDYFFHVKDGHGSHVIVECDELTEELIRFAALKAATYSSMSDSSSVPVDYTMIKYIKKIPGVKGSKVTYTKYKTIYVDPKRLD